MEKKIKTPAIETHQRHLNSLVESINQEVDCTAGWIKGEIRPIFYGEPQLLDQPKDLVINMDDQPDIGTRDGAVIRLLFPSIR